MIAPFDRALAARAAAFAVIAAAVAGGVVAATDEGAGWAKRVAVVAALLPLVAALGAAAALAVAAARGEIVALAAIGASRARVARGAVLGAALVALLAPCVTALRAADLTALVPRASDAHVWTFDAAGESFASADIGVRIARDGAVTLLPRSAREDDAPPGFAGWVTVSLALAAIAFPLASSVPRSTPRAALAMTGALGLALAAFQAVAARRLAPAWLALPPVLLLADAGRAFRSEAARGER